MKFTINSGALAETIAAGISSVPSRPANPILGGALIEASSTWVTCSSFNYDRATTRTTAADVSEPDDAVVSGRLLSLVGSNLPKKGDTDVTTSGNEMVISTGRTEFRLPMMHRADYPDLPVMDATSVIGSVRSEEFADAVRIVGGFASTDEKLVNLTGLNIACTPDSMTLCATDRYIVGQRRLNWSGSDSVTIDVPAADLLATIKAVSGAGAANIEILWDGALLGLRTSSVTVITRSLAEEFPDMNKVISRARFGAYQCAATVWAAELTSMLRRAAAISDDQNDQVDITIEDGTLSVTTVNSGTGNVADTIDAAHHGGSRSLRLNAKRLVNALSIVDDPQVSLAFQETGHMVSIFPGDMDPGVGELVSPETDSSALLIGIKK